MSLQLREFKHIYKKKTFACTVWCPEVANLYKCCLFALYCQTVSMVDIQPKSHDSGKT